MRRDQYAHRGKKRYFFRRISFSLLWLKTNYMYDRMQYLRLQADRKAKNIQLDSF